MVLDEILGLLEREIISVEDIKNLIETKEEGTELILTGTNLDKELIPYADAIYEIKSRK